MIRLLLGNTPVPGSRLSDQKVDSEIRKFGMDIDTTREINYH